MKKQIVGLILTGMAAWVFANTMFAGCPQTFTSYGDYWPVGTPALWCTGTPCDYYQYESHCYYCNFNFNYNPYTTCLVDGYYDDSYQHYVNGQCVGSGAGAYCTGGKPSGDPTPSSCAETFDIPCD